MDYLVPEMQSYHLDMGSLSGAGEMDAATHFNELYGGRGQVGCLALPLLLLYTSFTSLTHVLGGRR